tara:strand:+ start:1076 stop:1249 length:174 start_codon:yes stop_codon:yes gene_type:complete
MKSLIKSIHDKFPTAIQAACQLSGVAAAKDSVGVSVNNQLGKVAATGAKGKTTVRRA